jgi:hypothetical protein
VKGAVYGDDGGHKVPGRQRHSVVATLGLLLVVVVHAAAWSETAGALDVGATLRDRFPRIRPGWADAGSNQTLLDWFLP